MLLAGLAALAAGCGGAGEDRFDLRTQQVDAPVLATPDELAILRIGASTCACATRSVPRAISSCRPTSPTASPAGSSLRP